jgi:hypothetical protein
MPSSSAKQHRFMQAVAHSPSFAKKVGVSQSVGKDFSAADKGKTFNKGGTMKKGKRFNGEDGESGVEYHDYDPDKTYSGRFTDDETGGLAENTPTRSTAKAAPATPSRAPAALVRREKEKEKSDQNARELARTPKKRFSRPIFEADLSKRLERRIVGMKQGGSIMESKKMMGKEVAFMKKKGAPSSMIKHEEKESKGMKFGRGGGMPPPSGARPDPRMMAARRPRMGAGMPPSAPPVMPPPPPGGMPPPAQPPMGMKKGGMPMKDGKPAFMQKKMMGGGMAKYAKGGSIRRMADGGMTAPMAPPMAPQQPPVDPRQMAAMQAAMQAQGGAAPMAPGMKRGGSVGFAKGGGIESRGKTKGTIIRMAAGGSVSSRADGIAQRGKTKFTNY